MYHGNIMAKYIENIPSYRENFIPDLLISLLCRYRSSSKDTSEFSVLHESGLY